MCLLRISELSSVAVMDLIMLLLCFKSLTSYPKAFSRRFKFLKLTNKIIMIFFPMICVYFISSITSPLFFLNIFIGV